MFKKVPYGVKVRVRGNEQDGFIAEYATCCSRFLPFFDRWFVINYFPSADRVSNTFPTFELAKEAAMKQYDSWIGIYKRKDDRKEKEKQVAKAQRKVVWEHP